MAYLTLLENETAESNFLAVIKPRRRALSFSVHAGAVYVAAFSYGEVVKAFEGSTALTAGGSPSLSAGQFYYDTTTSSLYVRLSGGGNPNSIWLIAEYEMYFGTYDAHWHRIPTDTSTRTVYFEPLINQSPALKQSVSDSLFGFNPVQTLQIGLNNSEHFFEPHLHDGSFNDAEIKIYHWLGSLAVANVALVLNGVCKNVSLKQPNLSITLFDRIDILSNEWRNPSPAKSFFTVADFAALDPQFENQPIRAVYGGPVGGFVPANIDYNGDPATITTSDNRDFVVQTGQTNLADLTFTVAASPASTTTRTYLTAAPNGVNVGDSIWLDKATDEYAFVTAIGANYLDHSAIVTPAVNPETVKRGFVGFVSIVQDNVEYKAHYNRDFTLSTSFNGTTSGFSFRTTLEANLSIPNTLSPTDKVFCRVYGPSNFVTLGGPAFGTSDTRTSGFNHPAQIILDILKRCLGMAESEIDAASFTAALSDAPYGISLVLPDAAQGGFEDYKTILSKVIKSALMRLIVNADGKFALSTYKPLTAATKTIADDEILLQTIQFNYNYDELISDVVVEYNYREDSNSPLGGEQIDTVAATSDAGAYLHKASKTKTERLLWTYEVDAQTFADRLSFIFGDRLAKITLQTKNRFFNNIVGDVIALTRAALPGNTYNGSTLFSRSHRVSAIEKSLNNVTIDLDDQKGAEDNLGSW